MQELADAKSLGLTLPSPAYIFGVIVFSFIGLAAFRYGRRQERRVAKWIGIGLMVYPYVVPNTVAMYLVGCGLCAALFYYRE